MDTGLVSERKSPSDFRALRLRLHHNMKWIWKTLPLLLALITLLAPGLQATEYWETHQFEEAERRRRVRHPVEWLPPVPTGRFNYLHELTEIAQFLSVWQVSDPDSVDYGGMIEGESGSPRFIIETDNTQEAVWIWCRYGQLTGDTATYRPNLDAAWTYIMNFPAYEEEGTDSDYYRIHNCGWALVGEPIYRQLYNDSSFFWYSDTCAQYMLSHPLDFTGVSPFYQRLHPMVTGWAAGALYDFGVRLGDTAYTDTALSYGQRVKDWIEADPSIHLTDEVWAMSSGTAMWGVVNSCFREDSAQGAAWLPTYAPYMDIYELPGQWNNSWNIWYGNAYQSIFKLLGDTTYSGYHVMLTDTLLVQDTDEDGGVPATSSDPETMDQTWISCYLGFMGIEGMIDSLKDRDAGVYAFLNPTEESIIAPGDTIVMKIEVANFGKTQLSQVPVSLVTAGYFSTDTVDLMVGENLELSFSPPWVPPLDTSYTLVAYTNLSGDEDPSNDTLSIQVTVLPVGTLAGVVRDGTTHQGISSKLLFYRHPVALPYDSAQTDTSTGQYSIDLVIGTYDVHLSPEIPYPETTHADVVVWEDSTTSLDLDLDPALFLIVDDDDGDPYEFYYTSTAESLGVSYVLWDVFEQGAFPISSISLFATPTIVWFTGDPNTNTLTPSDQDSLSAFLDSGGNLFLTGQNIGEEIQGTPFYSDYLHASLVTPVTQDHILDGVAGDPIGDGLSIVTSGGGGAGNQTSQDVIAPIGGASSVFCYEADSVGGIRYDSGSYKVVYFGFGFEAVNRIASFAGRDTVLARILRWFGVPVGTRERPEARSHPSTSLGTGTPEARLMQSRPNPFATATTIPFCVSADGRPPTADNLSTYQRINLSVYDLSGRLVRTLLDQPSDHPTIQLSNKVVWDGKDDSGRRAGAGVYFCTLRFNGECSSKKLVKLQ